MNGSAVSTASTPPDLMMSAMVGNVTSTKFTLLGSTPFSTSQLTNSTCRKAPSPGAPTFLATKSLGSVMVMLLRTKAAMLALEVGFITDAPATATRSRPPSTACKNTVDVGAPIWIELERMAAGMFELMPIRTISASRPCFLKMPSSTATIAEAQSLVAVHPIWTLVWAWPDPANRVAASVAAARNLVMKPPDRDIFHRLLIIDILYDHIFYQITSGDARETRDISIRRPGKDRPGPSE